VTTVASECGCEREKKPRLLRETLREASAPAHRRLEARFSQFELSSLSGYQHFLEASAAALLPLEAALEDAGISELFCDWRERSRRLAITADLKLLGGAIRPLPPVAQLSRNQLFGTMYVLEGSRLGAKSLLRSIDTCGQTLMTTSTAYLRHGAGKPFWSTFLVRLERERPTSSDEAEMVRGACDAFEMFWRGALT
jgi:heme oxygenase (biliverdin-IX-beta and delta-forming)